MASRKYKIDEWYDHTGNENPVPYGTMVNIKLKSLPTMYTGSPVNAEKLDWGQFSEKYLDEYRIDKFKVVSYPEYEIGRWYDHELGDCPVSEDTFVTVKLRNGATQNGSADEFTWNDEVYSEDVEIVSFSIMPERIELPEEIEEKLIEDSENAKYAPRIMVLFHATTPSKAKKYRECGSIHGPVRGFTTLQAAMAWAMKVGRTVIYEIYCEDAHKLPDHHNKFGDAWWNDGDVTDFKCVFSAESDA